MASNAITGAITHICGSWRFKAIGERDGGLAVFGLLEHDLAFKRARPFIARGGWLTPDIEAVPTEPGRPPAEVGPIKQSPRWLALAGMAVFFTRKSHAALIGSCNAMIQND